MRKKTNISVQDNRNIRVISNMIVGDEGEGYISGDVFDANATASLIKRYVTTENVETGKDIVKGLIFNPNHNLGNGSLNSSADQVYLDGPGAGFSFELTELLIDGVDYRIVVSVVDPTTQETLYNIDEIHTGEIGYLGVCLNRPSGGPWPYNPSGWVVCKSSTNSDQYNYYFNVIDTNIPGVLKEDLAGKTCSIKIFKNPGTAEKISASSVNLSDYYSKTEVDELISQLDAKIEALESA